MCDFSFLKYSIVLLLTSTIHAQNNFKNWAENYDSGMKTTGGASGVNGKPWLRRVKIKSFFDA